MEMAAKVFEEEGKDLNTEVPTCSGEVLKICSSIIKRKGWEYNSIDIKSAYLQNDKIKGKVCYSTTKEAK